jgi:hypothetical protein
MKVSAIAVAALLLTGFASAFDGCQDNGCNDLLCKIAGLPNAIQCALETGIASQLENAVTGILSRVTQFIVGSPPLDGSSTRELFSLVSFLVELLFVPILMLNGLKLTYSSMFSAQERAEAKDEVRQVLVAMVLVWAAYDLYALATDATNAFSAALAPSQADWNNAVNASAGLSGIGNLVLLGLIVFSLQFFAFTAFARYILAYVGLFTLVISMPLEALPATSGIGRAMRNLVVANFIVQILQALFLKIAVTSIADLNTSYTYKFAFITGVLLVGALAGIVVYAAALLSSISRSPAARMLAYAAR